MEKTLQIRNVAEEHLSVLRTRAAQEGQSLNAYMRDLIANIASRPTMAEILADADSRRARGVSVDTADIVQLQREIRGE